MRILFTSLIILTFSALSFGQGAKTMNILIDGEVHTVTIGEPYKYANAKGDTIVYNVNTDGTFDMNKIAKDTKPKPTEKTAPTPEPSKAEAKQEPVKPAPKAPETAKEEPKAPKNPQAPQTVKQEEPKPEPKNAPESTAKQEPVKKQEPKKKPEVAEKKAEKTEKLPIAAQAKKTEGQSKLTGQAYRFKTVEFDDKDLAKNDKLYMVSVEDPVKSEYPTMEFFQDNTMGFCYNRTVQDYHGDYPEVAERSKATIKYCQEGKWEEKDNDLQVSLSVEDKRQRLKYRITTWNDNNLVAQKKTDFVF